MTLSVFKIDDRRNRKNSTDGGKVPKGLYRTPLTWHKQWKKACPVV